MAAPAFWVPMLDQQLIRIGVHAASHLLFPFLSTQLNLRAIYERFADFARSKKLQPVIAFIPPYEQDHTSGLIGSAAATDDQRRRITFLNVGHDFDWEPLLPRLPSLGRRLCHDRHRCRASGPPAADRRRALIGIESAAQRRLDQLDPVRGPDRDHLVVEVVGRMMQARARAVADEDEGARRSSSMNEKSSAPITGTMAVLTCEPPTTSPATEAANDVSRS